MLKKHAIKVFLFNLMTMTIILGLAGCGGGGSKSATAPVYQAGGTGVILQSKHGEIEIEGQSFMKSALSVSVNPTMKQMNLTTDGFRSQTFKVSSGTPAVDQEFLEKNIAYIVLTWDQVNGAGRYQVFYGEQKVWDSKNPHPKDPDSDRLTIAYLDLDEELSEEKLGSAFINGPGQYEFRVYALKSNTNDTVIHQFSAVTVSLGMILGDFPTEIEYDSDIRQLAWIEVKEADGYRVEIYEESDYKTRLFDSGTTLLTTTSCDLTGADLEADKPYFPIVNAYAVDGSGRPLEITRGIQE